jgi:hypothetical protein
MHSRIALATFYRLQLPASVFRILAAMLNLVRSDRDERLDSVREDFSVHAWAIVRVGWESKPAYAAHNSHRAVSVPAIELSPIAELRPQEPPSWQAALPAAPRYKPPQKMVREVS